ncbi:phenylalanine ammonia-lyase [Aureobasidium pullulans]|uniref:Phenylalanine ammonia-lyase n=1 Tax=Aureobasidium pullulans TaxID=5580 RepID=A0A4S9IF09_AURPU|nr:phenylalanine ammonia-lyase [Aureobasidium pullulans]THZ38892.1 phenylalanine ammonia-lyase [Aureobasidium pullulans]TIA50883.1 phenylalanine ammonia-lyase [Aureobasidium pullulans]
MASHVQQTPPYTREPSPKHGVSTTQSRPFINSGLTAWNNIQKFLQGDECIIDGSSLDIAGVVAVAKYGTPALLSTDDETRKRIDDSVGMLRTHLDSGHLVYGVSTGFGGSADTRTDNLEDLQRALVQHQNTGVLTSHDIGRPQDAKSMQDPVRSRDIDMAFSTNSMPTSWVRASMLTRCNSIIRGHSGVRISVGQAILKLLNKNIIPVVPLRGSISASGDLSPLSYVAGAIEGSPDIYVRLSDGKVMPASEALEDAGIEPVVLGPKEGLGLLNGTAFSAATASLALHQSQDVVLLSQVLTAMGVEALQGSAESFWPQIANMRPHPGQIESAANIFSFLQGSQLAKCVGSPKDTKMTGLYQDRYALRTSSQWLGPQIEDLLHATSQITTELNSTTDNPLIDVESDHVLHGGNFQAAVVTSTMDRARLCLERLGKMLFSQATEIINPMLNGGLPANLSADDPSLSFTCKGIDINMASYQSELGFLANPVGNHVQSAEMHNQAINSLALISSRYTFQALDTIYLLSAAHLFVLCQALDLRVLQNDFLESMEPVMKRMVEDFLSINKQSHQGLQDELVDSISTRVHKVWPTTTTADLDGRCKTTADAVTLDVINAFAKASPSIPLDSAELIRLTSKLQTCMQDLYEAKRQNLFKNHLIITPTYLGNAAKRMYQFVRGDLGVMLHRGLVEHPTQPLPEGVEVEEPRKSIGSRISVIYEALRDGRASAVLMACAEEGLRQKQT